MAVAPSANPAVFDLKSATLTLVALVLKSSDLGVLAEALKNRFGDSPGLFDRDPLVIDLAAVADEDAPIDFAALCELLRGYKLLPLAVKGGSEAQMQAARDAGLAEAPEDAMPPQRELPVRDLPEVRAAAEPAVPESAAKAATAAPLPTVIIDKPLRSGQQVYARGADLIVLGAVNFGAEVIADGSIHVYAPLRGRAIAGARGHTRARIFSTSKEPQHVSNAGT